GEDGLLAEYQTFWGREPYDMKGAYFIESGTRAFTQRSRCLNQYCWQNVQVMHKILKKDLYFRLLT
ncbi:hypothetical protein HAX54_007141, partial [Datura stramonium]|nr:hypothetical protein [Datura stramonium]